MSRRSHSTVDKLPAELRSTLMRMLVDGYWPDEFGDGRDGKPTYDDCVDYIAMQGFSISRTALNRWGQKLNALELLGTKAEIVRNVLAEGEGSGDFAENQRVTANLLNARIMEATLSGKLTSKQARELAAAAKDCMKILIDNDQYRQKIKTHVKEASEQIEKEISDADIRKQVQKIIDERLGVL